MLNIVAVLKIRDLALFDEFESKAVALVKKHSGELVTAFETDPAEEDLQNGIVGTEIHYLRFPDLQAFERYRSDPALATMADLRSMAIHSTQVYISNREKHYD